jgi:hypothetical protein
MSFLLFPLSLKACNNFLILTTLLTSVSSVSVKHRAVYRTLQLAVSPRSAHSSNLWHKRLKGCVKGESALLLALLLGKELSEQTAVIARNLPILTHSWNSFFVHEKELQKSNAKNTPAKNLRFFGEVLPDFIV